MQSDYVVRLTGQDNLSSTVRQVKKELQDVGSAASSIEKIDAKFNKIINSSAPLKRQLRDLQGLMAKMNMDGLSNTEQFTKIAQEAGKIKDAIADASTATQRFANDTMGLQAGIQALQGIAAAGTVVTGTMALLGTENEDVARSIQKVQGALAVLNGVQTIANSLNKDSVLMQKLKQIQLAANTAATTRNTVAEGANTVAVGANTTATKAWNVVKAISKALLGNFTGLLIVGAGALATYAIATDKSSKEQEEHNRAIEDSKNAVKQYNDTVASTFANMMVKYDGLKNEWNELKSAHQKNQFIKDNATEFKNLGIEVNNVDDAEKAFNSNTNAVVEGFRLRAQAAALAAESVRLYQQQIQLEFAKEEAVKNAKQKGLVQTDELHKISEDITKNEKELKAVTDKYIDIKKRIPKTKSKVGGGKSTSTSRSSGGGGKSTVNEVKPVKDSVQDLQNRISELQKKVDYGLIPSDKIAETVALIDTLKERLSKLKIEIATANVKKLGKVEAPTQTNFTTDLKVEGLDPKVLAKFNEAVTQMALDQMAEEADIAKQKFDIMTQAINDSASAMGNLGSAMEMPILNAAGILANAIATMLQSYAWATSDAAKKLGAWGWVAFAAAGLAQVTAVIAQMKNLSAFANGGIVGGGSLHGDSMLARVNSGEMILNGKHQKTLFDAIDSGKIGGGTVSTVTWRLKGSDLYGSMKNYSKGVSKTGHITGIK